MDRQLAVNSWRARLGDISRFEPAKSLLTSTPRVREMSADGPIRSRACPEAVEEFLAADSG
jgi:hypothetical protein